MYKLSEIDECSDPYNGVDGVVFMYDTTNKQSFDNLKKLIKKGNLDKIQMAIVGNKCDLESVVDYEEAEELAT